MPFTVAPLVNCSSRAIAHVCPFLIDLILITGIIHHKSKTPEMCKVLAKASCEREAVNSYQRGASNSFIEFLVEWKAVQH